MSEVHDIQDILSKLLTIKEMGYTYVKVEFNKRTGTVRLTPMEVKNTVIEEMIDVLATILLSGHKQVIFDEDYDEDKNKYSLLMHPVIEEEYEPYKVNLKEIDLN